MIYQKNKPEILRVSHLIDGRVKFFRTPVAFGHGMYIKPDVRTKAILEKRLVKLSGPNMGIWRVEFAPAETGEQYFIENEEVIEEVEQYIPIGECCVCRIKVHKNDSYCQEHYLLELGVELDPSTQSHFYDTITTYPVARRT